MLVKISCHIPSPRFFPAQNFVLGNKCKNRGCNLDAVSHCGLCSNQMPFFPPAQSIPGHLSHGFSHENYRKTHPDSPRAWWHDLLLMARHQLEPHELQISHLHLVGVSEKTQTSCPASGLSSSTLQPFHYLSLLLWLPGAQPCSDILKPAGSTPSGTTNDLKKKKKISQGIIKAKKNVFNIYDQALVEKYLKEKRIVHLWRFANTLRAINWEALQ